MNARINKKILEGYDSFILWGALDMGGEALKQLRKEGLRVAAFCDSDPARWGTKCHGLRVIGPDALASQLERENALTVVCSSYAKHVIASKLEDMGLPYVYFSKMIYVEITSFCNQTCTFCPYEYIERKKGNLDFELAKGFLQDLRSEKSDVLFPVVYPHVLGEPLVSKDFWRFLDLCQELGIYVCVVTNFALMDGKVQERLFRDYEDVDVVLSVQGPTEKGWAWRGEKKLSHGQWIDRIFEIIESKYKFAHSGMVQICTICPDVVNGVLLKSDSALDLFHWYDSLEDFKEWKRSFGQRCLDWAEDMKGKYPESYEKFSKDANPILYFYNKKWTLQDLDAYVEENGPAQFEFLPDVHIYAKKFGLWGVEKYFGALLPPGKYFHWEENWFPRSEACDRVGDASLLSSGQLVMCNIDNEADYVFADLNKGEKYTDPATQARIKALRDNLSLSALCRRCKSRAHVFDTDRLDAGEQEISHYGMRWHKRKKDAYGVQYRDSYDYSYAFVYPRIDAGALEIDMKSLQDRKHHVVVKIMGYDEARRLFAEEKTAAFTVEPGQRLPASMAFAFKTGTLYRVDLQTPTQNDLGVSVYGMKIVKGE